MGTMALLALAMATDPIRLGVTLLLISRPRPILNLVIYWMGAMLVGVTSAVIVLTLMRDFAPALLQSLNGFVATPAVRHAQVVAGALALLVAVSITTGLPARRRFGLRMPVPVPAEVAIPMPIGMAEDPSALLLDPVAPTRVSLMMSRVRGVLQGESLWVPFAAGLGTGPAPLEYLVALVAILALGGQIGEQISAAVLFNVIMLAVCEITLFSYLTAPERTQAIVGILNGWVSVHRRQILSVIIGVAGVCLVLAGSN